VTIVERVRHAATLQPKLRRVPLRTKLVAAVLALVFAALMLISAASTYAIHKYLIRRIDNSLSSYVVALSAGGQHMGTVIVPPDYYICVSSVSGVVAPGLRVSGNGSFTTDDMPAIIKGVDQIGAVAGKPYTVQSPDGKVYWRVLVAQTSYGVVTVAEELSPVDLLVSQMIWVDLLVGAGALIALASLGAALVRQSLIPLVEIERVAAAIGAGDLSRRVPDPEDSRVPDADVAAGRVPTTELGRLSRALNAMLAQIEAAFVARAHSEAVAMEAAQSAQVSEARAVRSEGKMRQFVADASHELRTPLTTIRGFAELYRQGAVQDPDDVARLVRRIEDEAQRMGLLVEDLLLLARLDRERPLNLAPVELPVLALDAVQAAEAMAPDRDISLEILDAPERLVALGDDGRLRQVIGNLMTNALVHTPSDATVTLRVHAEPGDRAAIEVIDTGKGLSPDHQGRIFERFYRADEARTRNTEREATGTGLGLAIVAAIVRAHQGDVEVSSESGKGTTFKVTLPALNADKGLSENLQE
jgi:two-component system OmpR family sensor kinase